jgi:hypothetical protein
VEFEPKKETLLQKLAFPSVALALFLPMVGGVGIGYLLLSFFGKIDALNQVFEKPIAALTLNDLLGAFGTICILLFFGWFGKFAGTAAMNATTEWFEEKELSAMPLTDEDIRVYECPRCNKMNTYRHSRGPDRYGQSTYKCSTPDCEREVNEKSLASEIHRKD